MPPLRPTLVLLGLSLLAGCGPESALRVSEGTSVEAEPFELGPQPGDELPVDTAPVDLSDDVADDSSSDAAADATSADLAALEAALSSGQPVPQTATVRSAATAPRPLDELERRFLAHYSVPEAAGITQRSPNANAYACLAAANALARADDGAAFSAAAQQDFVTAVRRTTDALVQTMDRWRNDGWGLPDAWDAFSDGSTNPATTAYAFQTGLVLWCFSDAARVLAARDPQRAATLVAKARAVLTEYASTSYATVSHVGAKACTTAAPCGHFWYSRSANDRGRFVKNTNVLMGAATYFFGRAVGLGSTSTLMTRAAASLRSQVYEVAQRNLGYLGRSDRGWSARVDRHNALEIYALLHAAELRRAPSYVCRALQQYRGFYGHTDDDVDVTASCHLARRDATAKARCEAGLARYHSPVVLMGLVMDSWPADHRTATQLCAAAGLPPN